MSYSAHIGYAPKVVSQLIGYHDILSKQISLNYLYNTTDLRASKKYC